MSLVALVGIALGTLVSEDLATVAAGGLVREGYASMGAATLACVLGVYLGDLALWLAGRFLGRRASSWAWVRARMDEATSARLCHQLDRHLGAAVVASRFLPGSRLPMYLAAGAWGRRPVAFAAWSLVAVLLWTPLLLWATFALGAAATAVLVEGTSSIVHRGAVLGAGLLAVRIAAQTIRAQGSRLTG